HELALHTEIGIAASWCDGEEARRLEPALADAVVGAGIYEDDAVVDPPRMLEAARSAAEDAGARVICGIEARAVTEVGGRVTGLDTAVGTIACGAVVLAAGSWSPQIAGTGLAPTAVEPMRGQMLEIQTSPLPIGRLLIAPDAYLSPRADGRVLVGATVERVGFETAVTAGAAAKLLSGAIAAVPAPAAAHLRDHWCGFRPRPVDDMPAIGPGAIAGLVIATGHFRSGIVLAPITAELVAALVTGEAPAVDL